MRVTTNTHTNQKQEYQHTHTDQTRTEQFIYTHFYNIYTRIYVTCPTLIRPNSANRQQKADMRALNTRRIMNQKKSNTTVVGIVIIMKKTTSFTIPTHFKTYKQTHTNINFTLQSKRTHHQQHTNNQVFYTDTQTQTHIFHRRFYSNFPTEHSKYIHLYIYMYTKHR